MTCNDAKARCLRMQATMPLGLAGTRKEEGRTEAMGGCLLWLTSPSSDCRLFDASNSLADVSLHESFSTFPDALPLCFSSSPSPSVEIPALRKLPDSRRTALLKMMSCPPFPLLFCSSQLSTFVDSQKRRKPPNTKKTKLKKQQSRT